MEDERWEMGGWFWMMILAFQYFSFQRFKLVSACAAGEEFAEGGQVRLVGAGFDPVEAFFAHVTFEIGATFFSECRVALTSPSAAGVDFDHFASFGVFQGYQPYIG